MASRQILKQRIKSIKAISKITSAMEMIANAKLLKIRKKMLANRDYANEVQKIVNDIILRTKGVESPFLTVNQNNKSLYIIFSNDLGMCGGYTAKLNNYIKAEIKKDDLIVLIGHKSLHWLNKEKYQVLTVYNGDSFNFQKSLIVGNLAIDKYLNKEIGKIKVLYTEFINNVSFEPTTKTLLPYEAKETDSKLAQEILFEPNATEILDDLIPSMISNLIYSTYLRSKTSEQASRRLAMENATDNANELREKLTLTYNQARQQAITQEITEIVAGANV